VARERRRLKMRTMVILGALVLVVPITALADTYLVLPDGTGDFPTIQAAVDGTSAGDVIELADGIFQGTGNRDVRCEGTLLTLRSASNDPDVCVIDCEGTPEEYHTGFVFVNASSGTTLQGVTVVRGCSGISGGGVRCMGLGGVSFVNCVFRNNRDDSRVAGGGFGGGGVGCGQAAASFADCRFESNSATGGGAIACFESIVECSQCTFSGNTASEAGGAWIVDGSTRMNCTECVFQGNAAPSGAVLLCDQQATATFDYCTIVANAGVGAGASVCIRWPGSGVEMSHTIVGFNEGGEWLACGDGTEATLRCSNVFGNYGNDWVWCLEGQLGVEGNISADPLFCDRETGDFRLDSSSPCAPVVNPSCGLIGALPVGCSTPIWETTWGAMKALFRGDAK
jgi:predicted outer membrane repeat protein